MFCDWLKREKMNYCWWINGFPTWIMMILLVLIGFSQINCHFCWSLNEEGIALLKFKERVLNDPFRALSSWNEEIGEMNPCSWFGIGCAHGHVVSLNLENLCLEGTVAPELHHLLHIKSIKLRNNSFSGFIPEEIRDLKGLELLDLGYNNFSRPFLPEFGLNISTVLLDNNGLSCHTPPELEELVMLSGNQVDENHVTSSPEVLPNARNNHRRKYSEHPRVLKDLENEREKSFRETTGSDEPDIQSPRAAPPPVPRPSSPSAVETTTTNPTPIVLGAVVVGLILVLGVLYLWSRIRKAGPGATGLSGQLRKAFVAGNDRSDGFHSDKRSFIEGMPNLRRSELETACEDFSNVIGSSSIGNIYKGTLSNGVEIAVTSLAITSAKDWSRNLETQFRKKIETLSRVNHKNFVNLIGYCEEEEPFARMMVFEYAPNGSLFEHLHIREAEHLDWGMRLRVAMGMAYCLEHMHQLVPPVTHLNLNSSAVNFSEDYAAKISDFCFWNEVAAPQVQPLGMVSLSTSSAIPESNVYSFGLLLLEMMTGRIPYSLKNNSVEDDWVSVYLEGGQPLRELVDPMLRHFDSEKFDKISEVIIKCLHRNPQQRPTMREVAARLIEITRIDRDKAVPRLSPLWWAELDIRSVNGE